MIILDLIQEFLKNRTLFFKENRIFEGRKKSVLVEEVMRVSFWEILGNFTIDFKWIFL